MTNSAKPHIVEGTINGPRIIEVVQLDEII